MMWRALQAVSLAVVCFGLAACATAPSLPSEADDIAAITEVLTQQQADWNAGDIPAFMAGYWQSESLRFASGGSTTHGWQATLNRYLASYETPDRMGQLDFSDLEIQRLGPDAAVVHGRWKLERDADMPSGQFTLIWRRIDGDWRIISDTTTSAD